MMVEEEEERKKRLEERGSVERGSVDANLLHAQTIPRPSAKRNEVAVHGGINIAEPALRAESKGAGIHSGIGVHEIGGHADRDLRVRGSRYEKDRKERQRILTPAGTIHSLYWIGTSGEQRGSLCMTP